MLGNVVRMFELNGENDVDKYNLRKGIIIAEYFLMLYVTYN